jgi:hypothetical protein
MTTALSIKAGTTHTEVIRWASDVVAYKAITGITKTAPPSITAVAHGLKTGWPVAVEAVKGMVQINAQNSPPRDSDMHAVTVTGNDSMTLDGVNAIGYGTYTLGGALRFYVPKSMVAATARMDVVDRWRPEALGISRPHIEDHAYVEGDIVHVVPGTHYVCTTAGTSDVARPTDLLAGDGTVVWAAEDEFTGTTVYVALTETAGITIDDTNHTITWTIADTELTGEVWTKATAQLEVTVSGAVSRVREYTITLDHETTR